MTFSLLPLLFALLTVQCGFVATVMGEPSKLAGEALRRVVSGKTVHIETPIGPFHIHYKSNGSMTGQAPVFVASLGARTTRADGGSSTIVFASVGSDGWTRNNTASSCNVLASPFIGPAMTA